MIYIFISALYSLTEIKWNYIKNIINPKEHIKRIMQKYLLFH